jgi:hypothetical protein
VSPRANLDSGVGKNFWPCLESNPSRPDRSSSLCWLSYRVSEVWAPLLYTPWIFNGLTRQRNDRVGVKPYLHPPQKSS